MKVPAITIQLQLLCRIINMLFIWIKTHMITSYYCQVLTFKNHESGHNTFYDWLKKIMYLKQMNLGLLLDDKYIFFPIF